LEALVSISIVNTIIPSHPVDNMQDTHTPASKTGSKQPPTAMVLYLGLRMRLLWGWGVHMNGEKIKKNVL